MQRAGGVAAVCLSAFIIHHSAFGFQVKAVGT
jgi:ABC-type uncharacterized transport system permease subunit